jgi:stage II sporulation protein P
MSYYNREYKNEQVIPGIDDPGTGTTTKDGNNTDAGTNRYEGKQGLENGTNGQDTGEGEDKGIGQGEGMNNDQGSGEDTGKEHGKDTVPGQTADGSGQGPKSGEDAVKQEPAPQPVSSVSYEEEDENEDDSDLVASDEIVLRNFTKHTININELLKEPLNINFAKKGPKVLIYHTHTSESYVLREEDLGKKDVPSFNSNPKYNVVRVGEELARNLKKYGIETLHNGTVHDKTRDAAYGLSINTLKSYQKSYPSIKIYIDIHRDAVGSEKPKLRMVKKINGKNAAQIMFVVGSDGTLPHPEWKENLKFVLKLQKKLNEKYPGLAKPLWITGKRYNQQISNHAILIEVGGDGNLLSECLESMKYLAEVLNEVMLEE